MRQPFPGRPEAVRAAAFILALVFSGGGVCLLLPELLAQGSGATRSDARVKVTAKADKPDAEGRQVVNIAIAIEPGWHIYANPPGLKDLEAGQTTVTVSAKVKPEDVQVEYPAGHVVKDAVLGDYNVYENKVSIKAIVRRAKGDTGPLEVSVKLQACNDKMCLLPATVKQTVP
jgi:DsbC/DsbD-like thiol-disulfide interchange protein